MAVKSGDTRHPATASGSAATWHLCSSRRGDWTAVLIRISRALGRRFRRNPLARPLASLGSARTARRAWRPWQRRARCCARFPCRRRRGPRRDPRRRMLPIAIYPSAFGALPRRCGAGRAASLPPDAALTTSPARCHDGVRGSAQCAAPNAPVLFAKRAIRKLRATGRPLVDADNYGARCRIAPRCCSATALP